MSSLCITYEKGINILNKVDLPILNRVNKWWWTWKPDVLEFSETQHSLNLLRLRKNKMNILEDSSTGEVPQTNLPTDSNYKPSTKHAHTQIQLYEGSGDWPEGESMLEKGIQTGWDLHLYSLYPGNTIPSKEQSVTRPQVKNSLIWGVRRWNVGLPRWLENGGWNSRKEPRWRENVVNREIPEGPTVPPDRITRET